TRIAERAMQVRVTIGLVIALSFGRQMAVAASENRWIVTVAGGGEFTFSTQQPIDEIPVVDVRTLARDLDLLVEQGEQQILIRDSRGAEWRTANGSVFLDGPGTT